MALADTVNLIVKMSLGGNFASAMAANKRLLKDFDSQVTATGSRSYRAGVQIGTGIKNGLVIAGTAVGFLATNVGLGLRALTELEKVTTQTNAVLKSTKGAAGENAAAIRDLAEKYEALNATIDDKVIQSGENVLLTFTNIKKEAFEPALQAALDLSTAMGQDLQSSIVQVGKALNDPLIGLTALRRIGVAFSADQVTVIKRLAETGHVAEAQKIILAELNKEFGGSFLAGGQTTAGKVAKFRDAIEDLQKALAQALLPTIGKVADRLSTFLQDPAVIKTISDLGQSIADLFSDKNLAEGGKILGTFFDTAKAAAPVLKDVASATLNIVKTAVGLFQQLPKPLQDLAVGAFAVNKLTGGLVTNVAGGIVETILGRLKAAVVNVEGAVVNVGGVPGGGGRVPPVGPKGIGLLESIGLTTPVLAALTLSVAAAAGLSAILDAAINNKGGLDKAGKALTDQGLTLGANPVVHDPGFTGTRALGGKGSPLVVIGTGPGGTLSVSPGGDRGLDSAALRTGRNLAEVLLDSPLGKLSPATITASLHSALVNEFRAMIAAIKSNKPENVAAGVRKAVELLITKSGGSVSSTRQTIGALRAALAHVHDPKLAAAIRSALTKVEGKLPGREFAQAQLNKADKLIRDGDVSRADLKTIASIERSLRDHGLPHAAQVIAQRIAAAQSAQVAAAHTTTEAIRRKNLSAEINTTVNVSTSVSLRGLQKKISTSTKINPTHVIAI